MHGVSPSVELVARLRAAGCVFAEEEAAQLVEAAGDPAELEALVRRRVAGEPLEPLVGWVDFCGLRLAVEPGVFVPRQRTALLVREVVTMVGIYDQLRAGLDVITDGEQTRFDFNLSFYGFIEGIALEAASPRRFGPPAHDQRGKHEITGELRAPRGLGAVEEFQRLQRLAPAGQALKVSVPGPYTLSGRLLPNALYPDRWAVTEALLPLVRQEIADLVAAGAAEICVDEPSMSCYGYREDTRRFVDLFNRTVEPGRGRARICTHLCFGNFKGHAVGWRKYAP
ncbi:MAG TPA: hypothetical protein PK324_10820, partial [Nocardioides sp.]|nr:hypothetical protein [Nocardioides sp.]